MPSCQLPLGAWMGVGLKRVPLRSMKQLLVLRHVPHETLGTLDPLLRLTSTHFQYVDFNDEPTARPGLEGYGGLVVLGGPMNVDETDHYPHLSFELELIAKAIDRKLPVFGICLGAQLIAKTLGARVYPNQDKEIGWYDLAPTLRAADDPLFSHLKTTEKVFQWHGDTFEIPRNAVHLASSPLCPNQAFRYDKSVYALQFHLEVDAAMIARWLDVPENQQEIAALGGKIDPQKIRDETPAHIKRLEELSQQTFAPFLRLVHNKLGGAKSC